MISIKITGLLDMDLLKKINNSVLLKNKFWVDNSLNGVLNCEQAFNGLQKIYSGVS